MKLAVMQPYFFPYIGYFELIHKVDVFVFLTNVQYIKNGWVNRNRIKSHTDDFQYLTVPIDRCPQKTKIHDVKIHNSNWHDKHLSTLSHVYGNKIKNIEIYKHYELCNTLNLNELLQSTIKNCCAYLNIKTKFDESVNFEDSSNATQRILNICKSLNADEYINLANGKNLYSQKDFGEIKLTFMKNTTHENKFSILDLCFKDGITSLDD